MQNELAEVYGPLVCEAVNDDVPSWGLYVAAFVAIALGLAILVPSVPLLWGSRQGDLQGGLAGSVISIVCVIAGVCAIVAARRYPQRTRTYFHEHGIVSRNGEELIFSEYCKFDSIEFEVVDTPMGIAVLLSGLSGAVWVSRHGARVRCYVGDKRHANVWLSLADRDGVLESVSNSCLPDVISVRHGLHLGRARKSK